ncbi:MAG: hypothetical protein II817_10345 [Bacteroidales bacterium]|nr:hypothetical protein [Bacteroidales bacterium]
MSVTIPNNPVSIGNARSYSLDKNTCTVEYCMDEELKKLFPSLAADGCYKKGVGRTGGVPGYIKQVIFKEKLHQVVLAAWSLGENIKSSGSQDLFLNNGSVGMVLNLKTGKFDEPLTHQQLNADIKIWYYKTIKEGLIKGAEITDWYISQNQMLSRQLREEANVYGREALLNAAGLAVGQGIGKVAGKMTKAVTKEAKATIIKGKNVSLKGSASVIKGTKVPLEVNLSISINRHANTCGGRKVGDAIFNPKHFNDGRRRVNTNIDVFSFNAIEYPMTKGYEKVQDAYVESHFNNPIEPFSYNQVMGGKADFITDFTPIVGNVKAGMAAAGNAFLYYETMKAADRVEKTDMISEKSRREFGDYIKRLIVNDINSFNAAKTEQLLKLYKLEGYKITNMKIR